MSGPGCESCGRGADATLAFPDTTFTLCLHCVPRDERRHRVVALPGHEQLIERMLAAHQPPAATPSAGPRGTR
jgi:hypothetical protein